MSTAPSSAAAQPLFRSSPARRVAAALGALAVAAAPAVAHAQTTGSVAASATVLSPLTFAAGQNLAFGNLVRGTSKSVAPDDATSGRWAFTGQGAASLSQTLTLPTTLSDGATNTLAIGTWTGRYTQGADAASGTAFSPATGTAATFIFPGPSTNASAILSFRVGATVTAAAGQASGTYTGTVSISGVYTNL